MNLTEQLLALEKKSSGAKTEEVKNIMEGEIERLKNENIIENALKEGDFIKEFSLSNANNQEIKITDLLKKGPVVIDFYRGGWCPYCNLELRAYMEILDEIKRLGASLVAISPEVPDKSLDTIEKNKLAFEVLSDIDNKVAKDFGLVFEISEELNNLYKSFGINLKESQGRESLELPMAATYIINKSGKVELAFVKEDYKKRLDPKRVVEKLSEL